MVHNLALPHYILFNIKAINTLKPHYIQISHPILQVELPLVARLADPIILTDHNVRGVEQLTFERHSF